MSTPGHRIATGFAHWEGRVFGGIVLAAFLLYGIGSGSADQPVGLALVVLNSIAVTTAGLIGLRVAGPEGRMVGSIYLAGRGAEAALLLGGILLAENLDVDGADVAGYLLAMAALGTASIPFLKHMGRRGRLPRPLATWGIYGYAALVVGVSLELLTGRALALAFAVPGGLFELALGLLLLRRGFGPDNTDAARHPDGAVTARASSSAP